MLLWRMISGELVVRYNCYGYRGIVGAVEWRGYRRLLCCIDIAAVKEGEQKRGHPILPRDA